MKLIENKIIASMDELISMIERRVKENRGIISKIAMTEGSTPSNVTQRFQTLYKHLRELREKLKNIFSLLDIQNVLIDVVSDLKTEPSQESAPIVKRKKRRDPKAEIGAKRERSYQVYLRRANKILGFTKMDKPRAGFWNWYENSQLSPEVREQVDSLLKRGIKIWGVKPNYQEKVKRNLMGMLLSGFRYEQIDYILDFLEKNPTVAEEYKSDLEKRDFKFFDFLRFEAFKNSEEFTKIMKEQFPQVLAENRKKGRPRFPSQSVSHL